MTQGAPAISGIYIRKIDGKAFRVIAKSFSGHRDRVGLVAVIDKDQYVQYYADEFWDVFFKPGV